MGFYAWITLESQSFGIRKNGLWEPAVPLDLLVLLELPAPRVLPDLRDQLAHRDLPVRRADGPISPCSAGSPNKRCDFVYGSRRRSAESFHQFRLMKVSLMVVTLSQYLPFLNVYFAESRCTRQNASGPKRSLASERYQPTELPPSASMGYEQTVGA